MSVAMPADLGLAIELHPVVVVRVVADVARDVGLLEPADPVLQPRRARHRPRPGERVGIALVRPEGRRIGGVRDADAGHRRHVGDPPRLRAGRKERVREVDHRGHVLEREPARLDRVVEAFAGRGRRDDRQRRVRVAPEHDLEQVRLLVLGRHPGRGAGALDVDDDERQLDHDGQPHRLRLERDARTGRGGQRERPAVARADGRADRGDLVLGLERLDPERLVAGQLVQDVRGRGDRVRAVEQLPVGQPRGGQEAERRRLVAGDVAIRARARDGPAGRGSGCGTPRSSRRTRSPP